MTDQNRILSDEEQRLAEAVAVAEQLELMLRILLNDSEMLASKAGDAALLNIMAGGYQACLDVANDAAVLPVKIAEMLGHVRPQLEAIQANEALLRRQCSGAVQH